MPRDYRHNHLEFFELIRIIAQEKPIDPHWSVGTLLTSHARLPRKLAPSPPNLPAKRFERRDEQ